MSQPQTLLEHARRTLALAVPVMIARCGLVIMVTVSTAIAGQAGSDILAAYAASFAPHVTLLVFGIGLMAATTILTAQAVGAGRGHEVGNIWRTSLLIGTVVGAIEGAILGIGAPVLRVLELPPELAEPGGRALQMFAPGMPALFLFLATTNMLEGLGRPKIGMWITLSGNVVNAAAAWLLIEGHLGLPAMGAAGAALATTITRWCMVVAAVGYVLVLMPDRKAWGLGLGGVPLAHARKQLRLGLPLGLSVGLQTAAVSFVTTFAGRIGPLPIAAYQVCNNVLGFVFMLSIGLSTATGVRVATAVGRGDAGGRARAGWVGLGLVLCLQVVIGLLILLFRPYLARFYTPDPDVLALLIPGLALVALWVVLDGAQAVLQGALRAGGDIMRPMAIYIVCFWLIAVPLAWWWGLELAWGIEGLLGAMLVGFFLAAVSLGLRFHVMTAREIKPI